MKLASVSYQLVKQGAKKTAWRHMRKEGAVVEACKTSVIGWG